jgi:ferric-dicitrate binding protein FerR (iron transport regulator)
MANDINKNNLDEVTQAFLDQMDQVKLPAGTRSKEDIWAKIDTAIDEDTNTAIKILWPWYAAAASIVLVLGFIFFYQQPDAVEIATTNNEMKSVELADGSVVTLNARSTLTYQNDDPRKIHLDGEAFFEVAKGGDFVITTSQGTVSVLGTSFTVLDRGADYQVRCKTGRVRIDIPKKSFSQEITAGKAVLKYQDDISVAEVEPLRRTSF